MNLSMKSSSFVAAKDSCAVGRDAEIDMGADAGLGGQRNGKELTRFDLAADSQRRQQRGGSPAEHKFLQHFERAGDEDRIEAQPLFLEQRIEGLAEAEGLIRQRQCIVGKRPQRDLGVRGAGCCGVAMRS